MKLIDSLRQEHRTIEAVASAFVAYASLRADAVHARDGERFLRFFRLYAGHFHHGREEQVLFPALVRETNVPAHVGPIHALLGDHREMAARLDDVRASIASATGAISTLQVVTRYVSALLTHIDAESSVLFPESEARFRRASVLELHARDPGDEERAACADGLRLVKQYGSVEISGLIRGEGCACCPSFGVSCDGVEREWSDELEWEDMLDRVGD